MVAWPCRRDRWSCVEMPSSFVYLKTELLIAFSVVIFRGYGFIGLSFFSSREGRQSFAVLLESF